jgi:hypothetical protein
MHPENIHTNKAKIANSKIKHDRKERKISQNYQKSRETERYKKMWAGEKGAEEKDRKGCLGGWVPVMQVRMGGGGGGALARYPRGIL